MGKLGGLSIACVFAAIWAYYGLSSSPMLSGWKYVGIVPSALIVARAALRGEGPSSFDWNKVKRRYFAIVAFEVLAIILLTNVLVSSRHTDFIWPGIAVIVGVHFIPLASLFGRRILYITGASITALGVLTPLLPGSAGSMVLGLGAALTLWATGLALNQLSPKVRSC